MPLQKSITTESGATASYWRITGISMNPFYEEITILLVGFYDEAKYNEAKKVRSERFILERRSYNVFGDDYVAMGGGAPTEPTRYDDIAKAAYDYIQANDADFTDAVRM